MDLNDSLKQIVEKISGTLNFFDFTFLVSGTVTSSIIYFSLKDYITYPTLTSSAFTCFIVIVLIYVCGLISFTTGKRIRLILLSSLKRKESFEKTFASCVTKLNVLSSYDNTNRIPYEFHNGENLENLIYKKMWVDIRHHEKGIDTVIYLNRFVMMQAICEGLMFSCILLILWGLTSGIILSNHIILQNKIILGIVSAIFSLSMAYVSRNCCKDSKLLGIEIKDTYKWKVWQILKSGHLKGFITVILILLSFIFWCLATKDIMFTQTSFIPLGIIGAKVFSLEAQRAAEIQIDELTIAYKKFIINNN